MSDMKKLLEDISKFSFAEPGNAIPKNMTEADDEYCDACDRPAKKCVCDESLAESLMQEYKYFVKEAPVVAGTAPAGSSPVAAINPAGAGNPAVGSTTAPATNTAASQTGTAPAAGTASAGAQTQAAKPPVTGATATPAANQAQPAGQAPKPGQPTSAGAPGAGTVTPPNPQQLKQQTDAVNKMLNNPTHPMNAQLQALLKKAGSIPG